MFAFPLCFALIYFTQLGVQDPAVYTTGQVLEFVVLLWSKSADALKLLGQPAAVSVGYYKADFLPSSEVLRPREQSRQTRTLERMADGRAWLADTGRPQDGEPASELVLLDLPMDTTAATEHKTRSSRMQSWTADHDSVPPPSPTRDSLEEGDLPGTEHYQRLEGEVRIPPCRPVSYRYTEAGREYSLQLQITHPQYAHISPTGPGLLAEVPIWYISDRHLGGRGPEEALNDDAAYLASLPIKGATIPIPVGEDSDSDVVVWPKTIGETATQVRQGKPKIGQSFVGLVPPAKEAA
ncbi:hypothetical protein FB45DRAFT_109121 [Roridomyces roridus]|uniref:Uncharacterized protein n=1 Tax=Roridomyces roridus TaxID=1738132 RepID=A0AAD7BK86_9AGAR|nr:hypothetical protein FB45DRAFT_109121 [Roridomyces roridus]